MGDQFPKIKVAAVQAAPVFLDREGSIEKAKYLIQQAGKEGAKIIAFPEGFIPSHPVWYHLHSATSEISNRFAVELFKNAVEVPGPHIDALQDAARGAGAYVVMGVCEKIPQTMGTMFNSQVFISPKGELLGKHQKLVPTVGERLVHTGGYGDTLGAFETEFGPISGLICGENSNPLAVFALTAEKTRVHVMSWPNFFPTSGKPMPDRVLNDAKAFAQMSKACVISACGTLDEDMIKQLDPQEKYRNYLNNPEVAGGSVIVGPDREVLAGPLNNEEDILCGTLDLEVGVRMKLKHDFAGHYNRPDIFQLRVNRNVPQIYVEGKGEGEEEEELAVGEKSEEELDQRAAPSALKKDLSSIREEQD